MRTLAVIAIFSIMLASCGGGSSQPSIQNDPEESFAYHYNLGLAALEQKNYEEAIKHFENSLKLNSRIPRTHNEMGLCFLYLGKIDEAISHFEDAISLDPNMYETHNSLGVAYLRKGRYRLAEQHFNTALSSPEYGSPYVPLYNLGVMYAEQDMKDLALQKFNRALEEEDKVSLDYRIQINYQIGAILFQQEKHLEAIKHFEKVLVLSPKMYDAALKAGISAMKTNNPELARVMFRKVVSSAPNSEAAREARRYLDNLDR